MRLSHVVRRRLAPKDFMLLSMAKTMHMLLRETPLLPRQEPGHDDEHHERRAPHGDFAAEWSLNANFGLVARCPSHRYR